MRFRHLIRRRVAVHVHGRSDIGVPHELLLYAHRRANGIQPRTVRVSHGRPGRPTPARVLVKWYNLVGNEDDVEWYIIESRVPSDHDWPSDGIRPANERPGNRVNKGTGEWMGYLAPEDPYRPYTTYMYRFCAANIGGKTCSLGQNLIPGVISRQAAQLHATGVMPPVIGNPNSGAHDSINRGAGPDQATHRGGERYWRGGIDLAGQPAPRPSICHFLACSHGPTCGRVMGQWQLRVRTVAPTIGAWSAPVRFNVQGYAIQTRKALRANP